MLAPAVFLVLLAAAVPGVSGHGCMTLPNPRGSLTTRTNFIMHEVDAEAPVDYFVHFPAGPKITRPGAGLQHQRSNAGPKGWTPFEPSSPRFVWRAGVCGDGKYGPHEHLKGGVYYYGAKIVGTYRQGGAVSLELGINAHHNGYIEVHVCDVAKCPGGDISPKCFRLGHCQKLERAWVPECQAGYSKRCAPIDRNYPGRWYLPCYGYRDRSGTIARYGQQGTIKYKLPDKLHCEHCVLHWYWTSANSCNPPGVIAYYDGPDRPRGWGNCPGQGGARGGVARNQRACGGRDKMPEEYMSCADIRIVRRTNPKPPTKPPPTDPKPRPRPNPKPSASPSSRPTRPRPRPTRKPKPTKKPTPPPRPKKTAAPRPTSDNKSGKGKGQGDKKKKKGYDADAAYRRGSRAVRDIILVDRGRRVASLNQVNRVRVTRASRLSIEALTEPRVRQVTFRMNGRDVYTDTAAPFYIRGNRRATPVTWTPPYNQWVTLTVYANGDTDSVRVYFQK